MASETPGKKWARSDKVVILNPYGGVPSITFDQDLMATFDDGLTVTLKDIAPVTEALTNPTETFNLLNPADGTTVLGTATYQQVYVTIYSLYQYLITKYPQA
jgi:hypothetical protein